MPSREVLVGDTRRHLCVLGAFGRPDYGTPALVVQSTPEAAMSCHYRVLYYSPDLVIRERINVGVIVFDGERVVTRTLTDWSRFEAFTGQADRCFIEHYLAEIATWTPTQVRANECHYMSSLQLDDVLASTAPVEEAADRLARRFLVERVPVT
jgi:hypothetical protein